MKKILAFPFVRLLLVIVPFAAALLGMQLLAAKPHMQWTSLVVTALAITVLTLLVIGVERATTGRRPSEIGFNPHAIVRDAAVGVLLGGGLFTAVAFELALTGHYRIVAAHVTPNLWFAVPLIAGAAALEELVFREVLFRIVDEWAGLWIALAVSAILFGLAHAANPGATWLSTLAIAVEAGVLLGLAFAATQNVWFPIGLHFAWNFCEGPIYGTQISGGTVSASLFTGQLSGPVWLTGGAFGPEAGAPAVVTCAIASLCLLKAGSARRKSNGRGKYA